MTFIFLSFSKIFMRLKVYSVLKSLLTFLIILTQFSKAFQKILSVLRIELTQVIGYFYR